MSNVNIRGGVSAAGDQMAAFDRLPVLARHRKAQPTVREWDRDEGKTKGGRAK